jgi:uncharacterized protein YycO
MELKKLRYDEIRSQIKDGDVLLYKGKGLLRSGFVATLVQIVTRSDYSHAGIAARWKNRLMVIEAVGNGVIVNPLSLSLERYHATVEWYSCKEEIISDGKRGEMILYAQEELGKGFAVFLAFWFMVKILLIGRFSKSDRFHREKRYYCSEFVSNVYTRVGLDLKKERSDRYMSPDDIAHSNLLIPRGVLQR